jgi:lipopolysaccharide export system protein LptA
MRRVDLLLLAALAAPALLLVPAPTAFADLLDEEEPAAKPPPSPQAPPASAPKPASPPKPATPQTSPKPAAPPAPAVQPAPRAPAPSSGSSAASGASLAPKGNKAGADGPAADDSKQPVHFESKGLRALKEKGTAELIQDVVVTQGTLRLEADKAKIYYDDDVKDVVRVVAEGNIKIFKVDEESGEKIKAFGDRVEFDNKARTVVLEGNARLWRGADLVRGKKITYELDSGWIKADRVAGEVHPPEEKK